MIKNNKILLNKKFKNQKKYKITKKNRILNNKKAKNHILPTLTIQTKTKIAQHTFLNNTPSLLIKTNSFSQSNKSNIYSNSMLIS